MKKRMSATQSSVPGPMIRLYVSVATPIFRERFMARRCLNTTRVCLEVMRVFNVRCEVLSVHTMAMNKIYVDNLHMLGRFPEPSELKAWIADGAWALGIDTRKESETKSDWPGHLVAVVQDFLVDGGAIQLSRPWKGIEIPDIFVGAVTPRFMKGKDSLLFSDERGAQLSYHARFDDESYKSIPGFAPHEKNLETAAEIANKMATLLGRKPVFQVDTFG